MRLNNIKNQILRREKMRWRGQANKGNKTRRKVLLHYFRTETTAAYERYPQQL